MKIILLFVFILTACGLFLLLSGILRLPTLRSGRAIVRAGKKEKKLQKVLDTFYMDGAVYLGKYIGMNVYKKNRMQNVLNAAGFKNSRDVLSMLEHYKGNAGEDFRRELDIVCADMRSGSYEAALTRFEARMNSPQLSDVVRGLIGVLRGDDGAMYFQMLTHDFKQAELQRLKA